MNILPKYFRKKTPLTFLLALEECVSYQSERSQAFIYKKFSGYLMAISIRYVKDTMEAEDIVNESFVKIFKKISDFDFDKNEEFVEKSFKGWIARIVVNTSIDKLRVKKENFVLDDLTDADLKCHSVTLSTNLEQNDILNLLNKLPPIQKSIFNMFEIEGYSHDEISKMLDIPESTSRTYLARAKAKLRLLYMNQFEVLEKINHS